MDRFASPIICMLVIFILSGMLGAAQRGKQVTEAGTGFLVFRYHLILRSFALFMAFGVPIGITALVLAKPPKDESEHQAVFGLYALFAALSAPLLWETMRFALVVSPDGLDCRSPWRPRLFIRWEEIKRVSYSPSLSWFVISATGGNTFRLSIFVAGLSSFLEACEQNVSLDKLNRAKDGYKMLRRPFPTESRHAG